jgi:hypothetical protein
MEGHRAVVEDLLSGLLPDEWFGSPRPPGDSPMYRWRTRCERNAAVCQWQLNSIASLTPLLDIALRQSAAAFSHSDFVTMQLD